MQFQLYTYLSKHPIQMQLIKRWVRLGLPVPSFIKLQLANEIHAEMIARLMQALIKNNGLSLESALQVHYEIGTEMAGLVKDFLDIDPNDARSLSRIIDFLHGVLSITGKNVIHSSQDKAISHWNKCPLSSQLSELKDGGGPYYCHLYQEMYKGVLFGINKNARANNLATTQSQGCEYCELETWIEP
jgi:hypothetical protein